MGDNLKIGDLIKCEYDHYTGVGYAKVIKITNIKTKEDYQNYEIISDNDESSYLQITVKFLGYDMFGDNDIEPIVIVDEIRPISLSDIYEIYTEQRIVDLKNMWEELITNKFNFLYEHINRDILSGKKSINKLKIK